MTVDRRGGDAVQPPQPEQTNRSVERRRGLNLRRRISRRGFALTLIGLFGAAAVKGGARHWNELGGSVSKERDSPPEPQSQVESLDRKNIDVTNSNEIPLIVVNDLKDLVRTVVKQPYQGKFANLGPTGEAELDAQLKKDIRRNSKSDTEANRGPLYFTGSGKISGWSELAGRKTVGYPGFDGRYVSNTDFTPVSMALYGDLPLLKNAEFGRYIRSGKSESGGEFEEIEISRLSGLVDSVFDFSSIPGSKVSFYTGNQLVILAGRKSDGTEVVLTSGRRGYFDLTARKSPQAMTDPFGDSFLYRSLFSKTDLDGDRSNMSVEGYPGIPSVAAEDAVKAVRMLLRGPFRGTIQPYSTDPSQINEYSKLREELVQSGNRLYVSGTEALGIAPLLSNLDTPEARKAREQPHYLLSRVFESRMPKIASSIIKPEMDIRYKSNTDLEIPALVQLSGQIPWREVAEVAAVVTDAKLPDGRSYTQIPADKIALAAKTVLNFDGFKISEKLEGDQWKVTGKRESDGAIIEAVVARSGRFKTRVVSNEYRLEADEAKMDVPAYPQK